MSIKDFFVKEKPVFTGISRGVGGFGFGKAASSGSEPSNPYGGSASGGVVSGGIPSGDGFRYFVFISPGTSLVTDAECPANNISILCVGAGGGGGSGHAGGGGGGAVVHLDFGSGSLSAGSYTVAVGTGAAGGTSSPNTGINGVDSTFGTDAGPPSTTFIRSKGGGAGGGWQDGGLPGGSGGGQTGGAGSPGASTATLPGPNLFGGRAIAYGNSGGVGAYSGGGGGGSGSVGQSSDALPAPAPEIRARNPATIPANHPNYPLGGAQPGSPLPASTPYAGAGGGMISGPSTGIYIWPTAADYKTPNKSTGGFGGHGKSFPEFPSIDYAPAIPSPVRTNWGNAVTSLGIFGAGGGGGSHTNNGNPNTASGGGMGGIGGGGNGGQHPPGGTGGGGSAAINYTGSGGGGSGNQPQNGYAGANGIVIVKIKMA
jgi:hypothetical protein